MMEKVNFPQLKTKRRAKYSDGHYRISGVLPPIIRSSWDFVFPWIGSCSFPVTTQSLRYSSLPAATTTTVRRQGPPGSHRARDTWATPLVFAQKMLHFRALCSSLRCKMVWSLGTHPADDAAPTRNALRKQGCLS